MADALVDTWRRIISGDRKCWVLFRNGTCVVLMEPGEDLRGQAIALMREWGPVHAGSPAGDFSVITLSDAPGWAVTCHHDDILTYVSPAEMPTDNPSDVEVGLHGRSRRDLDAAELRIVHVEDKR